MYIYILVINVTSIYIHTYIQVLREVSTNTYNKQALSPIHETWFLLIDHHNHHHHHHHHHPRHTNTSEEECADVFRTHTASRHRHPYTTLDSSCTYFKLRSCSLDFQWGNCAPSVIPCYGHLLKLSICYWWCSPSSVSLLSHFCGNSVKVFKMAAIEGNGWPKTATNGALFNRLLRSLLGRSGVDTFSARHFFKKINSNVAHNMSAGCYSPPKRCCIASWTASERRCRIISSLMKWD